MLPLITPSCPDECAPLFLTTLFPLIKRVCVCWVCSIVCDYFVPTLLSNVRQYIKYGQSPRMVVNGDIRNYPQRMAIYKKFKISPFVYSLKRGIFQSIKKSQSLLCENSLFCCQRCLGLSLWCVGGALSASPNSLCELRNSCYASRTAARMEDSAAAGRRLSLVLSLAQETGKSVTKNIISRKL